MKRPALKADPQSKLKLSRSTRGISSRLQTRPERVAGIRTDSAKHIRRQQTVLARQQGRTWQVTRQECIDQVENVKNAGPRLDGNSLSNLDGPRRPQIHRPQPGDAERMGNNR